ncbi:hypothetical protein D920_03131 [Enterococcus faecalis 13-SD-W-01]|nr:hypothetical protein D920_03131 [Enterococcus faecalis 13-SD-W-01]
MRINENGLFCGIILFVKFVCLVFHKKNTVKTIEISAIVR